MGRLESLVRLGKLKEVVINLSDNTLEPLSQIIDIREGWYYCVYPPTALAAHLLVISMRTTFSNPGLQNLRRKAVVNVKWRQNLQVRTPDGMFYTWKSLHIETGQPNPLDSFVGEMHSAIGGELIIDGVLVGLIIHSKLLHTPSPETSDNGSYIQCYKNGQRLVEPFPLPPAQNGLTLNANDLV